MFIKRAERIASSLKLALFFRVPALAIGAGAILQAIVEMSSLLAPSSGKGLRALTAPPAAAGLSTGMR